MIPFDIKQLEQQKFVDDGSGRVALRVTGNLNTATDATDTSWDLQTLNYNNGQVTSIVYSLNGVTVRTVTMTYNQDGTLSTITRS